MLIPMIGMLLAHSETGDAAGGIAGLFMCGMCFFIPVLFLAINLALMFWMAKDAKARGMEGAIWIILVLFTGVVGFAIYLFSRPQGPLIQCPNCNNNRMRASLKCPHCGASRT